jgi:hypothetical protein
MQWAGGEDWESYVDKLADDVEDGVIKSLSKDKRLFPKDWEWKGEHWKIARSVSRGLSWISLILQASLPVKLQIPPRAATRPSLPIITCLRRSCRSATPRSTQSAIRPGTAIIHCRYYPQQPKFPHIRGTLDSA